MCAGLPLVGHAVPVRTTSAGAPLIGRDQELSRLHDLVAGVAGGHGAALVIEGAAGMGKTAVLTAAAGTARAAGFRELRCTGLQGGTSAGFAGLHELLHPGLDRVDALPARQRSALLTAFGQAEGPPADRLVLGLAALGLIEEMAAEQPVFLQAEDVHWLDRSSAEIVSFLARRLSNAPILMVATVRTEGREVDRLPSSLPRMSLGPLTAEESERVLDGVAVGLGARSRHRVLEEAGGNPLALRELATALQAHGLSRAAALPSPLPTTRRLEEAFLAEAAELPSDARRFLLVAVAGEVSVEELFAAGRELGLAPEVLDPVERTGLLTLTGGELRFRHPLVRSAVYGAASSSDRARAHQALAAASRDPGRAAWHRAAATYGRDESVATELEATAAVAHRQGAHAEAAVALRRAAALSPELEARTRRLAEAAEMARQAGMTAEAVELLHEGVPLATRPEVLHRLALTEWMLSFSAGLESRSAQELIALAVQLAGPTGTGRVEERVEVLVAAAAKAWVLNLGEDVRREVVAALQAVDADGWHPLREVGLALLDPVQRLPRVRSQLPGIGPAVMTSHPEIMGALAYTAEAVQDLVAAAACWETAADFFHRSGQPGDECPMLRGRGELRITTGRLADGLSDVQLSLRMAEDLELPGVGGAAATGVARAHAWRGETREARAALQRSRDLTGAAPLALVAASASWAAGLLALVEERYGDAVAELSATWAHPPLALWAVGDLVEAAVGAGDTGAVSEPLRQAEAAAEGFASDHLWTLVHRCRALLADGPEVGEHFERSVAAGLRSGVPLELARSRLAYGEWLRRERRIVPSREQLAEALQSLDAAGARPWADRAAGELRAAGAVPARAGSASGAQGSRSLTAQEAQIAQLAAAGMTNKEIADQIYLSHRTVAAHLYKVFPKLGITHRAQLRQALQEGSSSGPGATPPQD